MAATELRTALRQDWTDAQPAGQPRIAQPAPAYSLTSDEIERAAIYFRAVGLSDEACLSKVTQAVMLCVAGEQRDAGGKDRPHRALDASMRLTAQWLTEMVAACPTSARSPAIRGLAAWQLRGLLGRYPDAFLKRDGLPDEVRRAIERAATPIVPEHMPAPMVPQQLGDLPAVLRSAFWHRLGRRIDELRRKTLTALTRG